MMEFEFLLSAALILGLLLCAVWTLDAWSSYAAFQAESARFVSG